jgi:hypothetical protein
MSKRHAVKVESQLQSPPEALTELVLWVGSIYESVPADCKDSATVELRVWEDGYLGIERDWTLTYWRSETAEEMAKRLASNAARRESERRYAKELSARKAAEEIEIYERLKRKFEQEGKNV